MSLSLLIHDESAAWDNIQNAVSVGYENETILLKCSKSLGMGLELESLILLYQIEWKRGLDKFVTYNSSNRPKVGSGTIGIKYVSEFLIVEPTYSVWKGNTTLQSKMNAKLSKQRFWHCYENGLKTIQMIPHNLRWVSSHLPFTED